MKNNDVPLQIAARVAVISDIHGNLHAMDAVLEEIGREQVEAVVVCGDVASGPFPAKTINRLADLPGRKFFIRGNADREMVTAYDSRAPFNPEEKNPARFFAAWSAQRINQEQRDFLAGFAERIVLQVDGLGQVCFCHGTPQSDEEIITLLTPEADLLRILEGVEEKVVIGGHTHHQYDRGAGGYRVINAGSVGMPYEGRPGAYWALLGPEVQLRRTEYDVEGAIAAAESAGYPHHGYREMMLNPPKPEEVAAFFEQTAADKGERLSSAA